MQMAKVKILKSGETDIKSTDIWRFSFHSDYPTFKISEAKTDTIHLLAGNDTAYVDITHGLGYNPIFFCYVLKGTKAYQVPYNMATDITITGESGPTEVWLNNELIDANTLRVGVYIPYDYADGNEDFTVNVLFMLDEF